MALALDLVGAGPTAIQLAERKDAGGEATICDLCLIYQSTSMTG